MSVPGYHYSIFKRIESTNGADIMMMARELERKTTALARYKKHLTFNHTLKRENILPPSLKFIPPIRSKAGYRIARNTGLEYLRLRITQCHQNIRNLQTKIQELMKNLEDHLSREDMLALQSVVRQTSETNSERLADTHARKINDRISKETHRSTVVDQGKWVVNISKRVLTPIEATALIKGLNFSLTPRKVPVSKNTILHRNGYLQSESISQRHDTCLSR